MADSPFNSRRQPWQVTCPTCGAASGWQCHDATGAPVVGSYHDSRKDYGKRG